MEAAEKLMDSIMWSFALGLGRLATISITEWEEKEEGKEVTQQWEDDWDDDDVNDDFSLQLRKELENNTEKK
ncbi:putative 26S proteasome complex subunit sem1-1 [Morella rubra]|uniref:26S proteasome complex subunit SEM1 n=1 Tax=Morella rubra TaxID=262757 RepID=A0A6A1UNK9_9ROSI|nr:putative 26S proteasome complex subunit sem1-1 [Morella rubra]